MNFVRKLLILDQCPAHLNGKILYLLEKYDIYFIFIPKRMTSILQPLDRCINFPFKMNLKKIYRLYFKGYYIIIENIQEILKQI